MPRTEKEPRKYKYNRQYLETLPRKKLQALAKQESIRANIKSEDIVGQIMQSRALQQILDDEQTTRQTSPPAAVTVSAEASRRNSVGHEDNEEVLSLSYIRSARRLITQINNDLTTSKRDLDDIHEILTHANAEITKVQGMVKDMIEVRIEFEENIVKRLHIDRHLWDGTGLMPARHRVKWKAFVRESERKIAIAIEKKGAMTEGRQRRDEEVVQDL